MTVPLNPAFLDRIERQLAGETTAYMEAMNQPYLRGIRFNPLKCGQSDYRNDTEGCIPWACPDAFYLNHDSNAGSTIMHEAGAFYLQEPSAMIPAQVMNAIPGERILDLCAAPGGKSTQLGCALRGKGVLVSNEPIPKRAAVLSGNIERMGIKNALVTCAYPEQLAERWPDWFDGVQVDAPCSGEGMFRRHPESINEWSIQAAEGCAERQRSILLSAAKMVRPGGRLVYSTCTMNPAENEDTVLWFLSKRPDFSMVPFSLPMIDGHDGMFTCWPHRIRGEGQFVAKLKREGEPDDKAGDTSTEKTVSFGRISVKIGDHPDISGIRVLRMGVHLGEMRGDHFIPDHAAAMAKETGNAEITVMTDEQAIKYLSGETIPGNIHGWTVMYWRGLPLGWGKGSDGIIKNHYPKALRNQRILVG